MVPGNPDVFIEKAERFRNGLCEQGEFLAVLGKTQLFSRASERPGVLVHRFPNRVGEWVAVFSSPDRLGRCFGDCDFFAARGSDLVALLPDGCGLLVDPLDEHGVVLRFGQEPGYVRNG